MFRLNKLQRLPNFLLFNFDDIIIGSWGAMTYHTTATKRMKIGYMSPSVNLKGAASNNQSQSSSASQSQQQKEKSIPTEAIEEPEATSSWPRRNFSGIQPTGALHLGNYLGAVTKWTKLQKSREDLTICIVDMHSITLPHNPPVLRENILEMAATLLSCGIDPAKTTMFIQSSVMEHTELNWILSSLTTMARLGQLPQFKDKSRTVREVPLGLYVYPVLQAADIMLHKATHVPVGADQLQHIQLAQHLARTFNTRYGKMFPICQAVIEANDGSRVLSLRDPTKKMSKSETNQKATIFIKDPPEVMREKFRKAVSDFTSDISYDPNMRPGVSNLINIHAQVTGSSIQSIVNESKQLDTAKYKERVAEAVIEMCRPIRENILQHMAKRNELIYLLEIGAEKARQTAQQTMSEVKQRLGLGATGCMPAAVTIAPPLTDHHQRSSAASVTKRISRATGGGGGGKSGGSGGGGGVGFHPYSETSAVGSEVGGTAGDETIAMLPTQAEADKARRTLRRPVVPMQGMRVEKERSRAPPKHTFRMDTLNAPQIGFRPPTTTSTPSTAPATVGAVGTTPMKPRSNFNLKSTSSFNRMQINNRNASAGALANLVQSVNKTQEATNSIANSSFLKAAAASLAQVKSINNNNNTSNTTNITNATVNSPVGDQNKIRTGGDAQAQSKALVVRPKDKKEKTSSSSSNKDDDDDDDDDDDEVVDNAKVQKAEN